MKNKLFAMLALPLALAVGANAWTDDLDQGYLRAFGRGVLLASGKGFPEVDVYRPDQFEFRNRTFFIPAEEGTTLDFRAILPTGKKLGDYLAQLKKERGQNLRYRTSDYITWRVYPAFDHAGRDLVDALHPWPGKPSDEPTWGEPIVVLYDLEEELKSWTFSGCKWDGDLSAGLIEKIPVTVHLVISETTINSRLLENGAICTAPAGRQWPTPPSWGPEPKMGDLGGRQNADSPRICRGVA